MLPIVFPVSDGNSSNTFQELNVNHLVVLSVMELFILNGHFTVAKAYFENVFRNEVCFMSKHVLSFVILEVTLMDRQVSFIEFVKSKFIIGENVVDIKGPEIASSELLPLRVSLKLRQDVFFH